MGYQTDRPPEQRLYHCKPPSESGMSHGPRLIDSKHAARIPRRRPSIAKYALCEAHLLPPLPPALQAGQNIEILHLRGDDIHSRLLRRCRNRTVRLHHTPPGLNVHRSLLEESDRGFNEAVCAYVGGGDRY